MRVGTYLVVRICVRDRSGARGGGVDRYRRRRRRAAHREAADRGGAEPRARDGAQRVERRVAQLGVAPG